MLDMAHKKSRKSRKSRGVNKRTVKALKKAVATQTRLLKKIARQSRKSR